MTPHRFARAVAFTALAACITGTPARAERLTRTYNTGSAPASALRIELLRDDLVHFDFSFAPLTPMADRGAIPCSPMIVPHEFPGPRRCVEIPGTHRIVTSELQLDVDPLTLTLTISELRDAHPRRLATLAPLSRDERRSVLGITSPDTTHIYGLGEQFRTPGETDGDWLGDRRTPGNRFGNDHRGFEGGAVGNAQFPILYALGDGMRCFALFLDVPEALTWDLRNEPWRVSANVNVLRGYILAGPDLADLRRDYLDLTSRPPVPPKKALGLWVSEFGFDDWAELDARLDSLRTATFPVDGFVLDLQWFGGITTHSEYGNMGRLDWDRAAFPNPERKLMALAGSEHIGIIPIEESYISRGLPEHLVLAQQGALVLNEPNGPPLFLDSWWGAGGMLDWTNPAAGDLWHDWKRQALIDAGVFGHWTDLGEPENYDPDAWYPGPADSAGRDQAAAHNLYNLTWSESIARGYARNHVEQRPLILSRSGVSGSQRCGIAMWSGDIGSNLPSLAAHMNVQMHMSLSGVDYFGADVGGFRRTSRDGDENELYTIWFANAAAIDVPLRPHTTNLDNCYETAPDRVGDVASNLANLRQRVMLAPYYYALMHRAAAFGEPVVPPLVYSFQDDPAARAIGDEKMIGRDLLVATVTDYGCVTRDVYLPAGEWIDFHDNTWIRSLGECVRDVPVRRSGLFLLPMFARAGAILPLQHVDDGTLTIVGDRRDARPRDELIVRVFPSAEPSEFTLYEDDGVTVACRRGLVRETIIRQEREPGRVTVEILPARGDFGGAPAARNHVVELVPPAGTRVTAVTLDGMPLPRFEDERAWAPTDTAWSIVARGWHTAGDGRIIARVNGLSVNSSKRFVFALDG